MTLVIILLLIVLLCLVAGLRMGIMALDQEELTRKADLGHAQSQLVLPLREHDTQLNLTLLLIQWLIAVAMVFVFNLVLHEVWVVLIGAALIVVCAYVLPRAVLQRYGLKMASFVSPVLPYVLQIFYPLAKPLSIVIDRFSSTPSQLVLSKEELVKILRQQASRSESSITKADTLITTRALTFADKKVADYMTPKDDCVYVKEKETLTLDLLHSLHESSHDQFPVAANSLKKVTGILSLNDVNPRRQQQLVSDVMSTQVCYVNEASALPEVLRAFIQTKSSLFIVVNNHEEVVGLITIDDVLSQLMGKSLESDFSDYDDIQRVAATAE